MGPLNLLSLQARGSSSPRHEFTPQSKVTGLCTAVLQVQDANAVDLSACEIRSIPGEYNAGWCVITNTLVNTRVRTQSTRW